MIHESQLEYVGESEAISGWGLHRTAKVAISSGFGNLHDSPHETVAMLPVAMRALPDAKGHGKLGYTPAHTFRSIAKL